jgi:CheY-like chemotaxis protein
MMSDTDASAAPPRGAGETILVVDDEEDILGLVDDTLQKYGYQVILARNGAEGIATFVQRRSEIALVLTDIAMPVMDGTAMITAIKSLAPDMKIIASSGLPLHARQESVLDEGIAAFVSKPYSAAKLLVTVRRVLTDYA